MKKKALIIISILLVSGFVIYKYAYKAHRDIATEKADFSITVQNLQDEFTNNDSLSNIKYADKTIEIYGKITTIDLATKSIVIDDKLFAISSEKITKPLLLQQEIKIKGRLLGYDDLLEEFRMDQMSIIE